MNAIPIFLFLMAAIVAFTCGFSSAEHFRLKGLQMKAEEERGNLDIFVLKEKGVEEEDKRRFQRATCDLLSVSTPWGSLNHSACAAHCLAMRKGYKGGRCKSGVCHCRK